MHGRGVLFPEPAAWLTAYLLVLMFEGYKLCSQVCVFVRVRTFPSNLGQDPSGRASDATPVSRGGLPGWQNDKMTS